MKYKVLIVDDEKMIRMGIKNAMPWEEMNIGEVYVAASAKEAITVIEEYKPHIMVTDISMTEMTGLELVEHLRECGTELRIIVLTGFDRFDYARQALRLHVHDFLLKPIDEEELKKSILTQLEQLEAKRRNASERLNVNRAKGVKQQTQLEHFMQQLMVKEKLPKEQLEQYLTEFHFDADWKMRIGIIIPCVQFETNSNEERFYIRTIKDLCIGMIDETCAGITFSDENNRVVIAFRCKDGGEEVDTAEQLLEILKDELGTKPRIIWGSEQKGFGNLHISYKDAEFALNNERSSIEQIFSMDYKRRREDIFQEVFQEFRRALISSIGDKEQILHIFERFKMAVESYNLSAKYARSCCFELASAVYFAHFSATGNSANENISVLMNALSGVERVQACEVTEMFLEHLFAKEDGEEHELVRKVKRRIHKSLAEDLTVARLAEELYVTPNYLSRLFKRVTGEGCNEYIVRKRIEQAKSLLATTTLKAGEIAGMVGYHDMNYFSMAFKKHVGISPTKYRESVQNKEGLGEV